MRLAILIVALSACVAPTESSTTDGICTISDCPEGVTLQQMRGRTVEAAVDYGAPRTINASCTTIYDGFAVVCWADFFGYRAICNWRGCRDNGASCDEFEGCHLVDRSTPPPAPPPVEDLCSIQDQIDGVCYGAYTQAWEDTLTYTSGQGYDPYSRVTARCGLTMDGRHWCSITFWGLPLCSVLSLACFEDEHGGGATCGTSCTGP